MTTVASSREQRKLHSDLVHEEMDKIRLKKELVQQKMQKSAELSSLEKLKCMTYRCYCKNRGV
jgi:hypothetical protein